MKKLSIGIAGCGAIGGSLAKFIAKELRGQARLSGLYDINSLKSRKLSRMVSQSENLAQDTLGGLIAKSRLIIEAASAASAWDIARKSLARRRDVMIMSAGGIVGHIKELSQLARRYNARVYIPSGAISGVDALKASGMGRIKSVTLTTRKHPLSFKEVKYIEQRKINLGRIKKDRLLFNGAAKEAVKYFPQNINVAAVLSIAGIGREKTRVKIIASPATKKNIHEIRITSAAGNIITRTENVLHPQNPKTSFLAVLSAMRALKQIMEPVHIGT